MATTKMDDCPYNPPSAMAPIVLAPASRSCIYPVCHSSLSLFCALARSLIHSTLPITPPTFTLFATHLPHSAHNFTPPVSPRSCSSRHLPTPVLPDYMHDLGEDMGAAPHITELLWRSPKVCVAYCMGQAYSVFFRLRGPFAADWAWKVSEEELYPLVTNRGVVSNLIFFAVIVGMAVLNAWALVICGGLGVLRSVVWWEGQGGRKTRRGNGGKCGIG